MRDDIGLKTQLEYLAPLLGLSLDALYEKQRVLVREGVLPSRGGRGPHSGTPYTPENLTIFLVCFLASLSARKIAAIENNVRSFVTAVD